MIEYTQFCARCPKSVHCCIYPSQRKGFVALTEDDVKRICLETKKTPDEFSILKKRSAKALSQLKETYPQSEERVRLIALKNNKLRILRMQRDGRCIFLDKKGLCTIYEARPLICRIYPYWYVKEIRNKNTQSKEMRIVVHDDEPRCGVIAKMKGTMLLNNSEKTNLLKLAKMNDKECKAMMRSKGISKMKKNA